jgi:hypothetical protein
MLDITNIEREFMLTIGMDGTPRKLLNSKEIKLANSLVKKGYMTKGTSDDKYKSVIFYVDSYYYSKL